MLGSHTQKLITIASLSNKTHKKIRFPHLGAPAEGRLTRFRLNFFFQSEGGGVGTSKKEEKMPTHPNTDNKQ
jgi:hypothetical protein